MAKNDHMLAILWLLSSGQRLTAKQLADKLEVNVRSIYRYIDSLCASGVPIVAHAGHNGGYSLLGSFVTAPLIFDLEEQKALLHASVFASEAGYPFNDTLQRAIDKLNLYSNQEQASLLARHLQSFDVIHREIDTSIKPMLIQLEQAVAAQRSVMISYRKPRDGAVEERTIDPYGIIYWNNKWYTVGYCQLRQAIRSFRIERITQFKETDNTFNRPSQFSARQFFLQQLLPHSDDHSALIPLIIEGRSEALDDLCIHWLLGHYLQKREETTATFLLPTDSIHTFVPYYLLAYGRAINVLQPQSLIKRLIEITQNLMKHYEKQLLN